MVDHRREVGMGQRQDPQVFADPADRAHLRLRDVQPAVFECAPPSPAVELRFAAGDVDLQARPQFAVAVQILGSDRFLEPMGIELLKGPADMERLRSGVAVVCVHHEAETVPDTVANRPAEFDVRLGAQPDLHLCGGIAHVADGGGLVPEPGDMVGQAFPLQHHSVAVGLDPGAVRAADQLVERHARNLSGDVPQCDVHT